MIQAGAIALTRIRGGAHSTASVLVRFTIAAALAV